ncbi:zinc finger protein 335-like isoform X2 [Danio rerio]|uniref:Zinc finger protein 335-like isoform X2 n=1 Tax=Danio rerio TaxID=7955 RepID=A0AC58G9V1_DANRE
MTRDNQVTEIALSQDGQIQYVPITTEQQVVAPEDLEAVAHSAVTGIVRKPAFFTVSYCRCSNDPVYTEATPEQLEQLQEQGIQYDVITFIEE